MSLVLFDTIERRNLYPFTYNKAVADLRMGIFTVRERWEKLTGMPVFVSTEKYLQSLYTPAGEGIHIWIDATVMITDELLKKVMALQEGDTIADGDNLVAICCTSDGFLTDNSISVQEKENAIHHSTRRLEHTWQIMQWNDEMIRFDFELITKGRTSAAIPPQVNHMAPEKIFIEHGAKLGFCTLNASTGPIYIGKNAEVMDGSAVRGPFVLCENSVVKMNSRIYGATTLGPSCMGGGEIKNSVMMGYSNKAHDGYLGDSVIGEWCNFGAGSTNSNVKNTAGEIKLWNFARKEYQPVGSKCGVMMGDYTRVAINAAINTGSMIGISCNVYGTGLLPSVIDNFTWGPQGPGSYAFDKAIEAIGNWMQFKDKALGAGQKRVLAHIYDGKINQHDSFL